MTKGVPYSSVRDGYRPVTIRWSDDQNGWETDDGIVFKSYRSDAPPPRPREMTAADLSLVQCSERNYVIVCPPEMTEADLGVGEARGMAWDAWKACTAYLDGLLPEASPPDAPYSFWLGADHG